MRADGNRDALSTPLAVWGTAALEVLASCEYSVKYNKNIAPDDTGRLTISSRPSRLSTAVVLQVPIIRSYYC